MSGLMAELSSLHLVGVAAGAGLGAVCRSAVDRGVVARVGPTRLPWATLAVNVLGSLLLGIALGWSAAVATQEAATIELVIGTGFAGGLTTYSTFSFESFTLLREGRPRAALAYGALTVGLALAAVTLGIAAGGRLTG